jgi:hypothetical protein
MSTTSCHTVTLGMLLREADVHEKNGKRQEAAKIRGWVADLLSEQSKVVRSVWRRLRKPTPSHTRCRQFSHFPRATAIAAARINHNTVVDSRGNGLPRQTIRKS